MVMHPILLRFDWVFVVTPSSHHLVRGIHSSSNKSSRNIIWLLPSLPTAKPTGVAETAPSLHMVPPNQCISIHIPERTSHYYYIQILKLKKKLYFLCHNYIVSNTKCLCTVSAYRRYLACDWLWKNKYNKLLRVFKGGGHGLGSVSVKMILK